MRTSDLGVSEGQHYVYPGVRGPLLLPSDYIRKFFFFLYRACLFIFNLVFVLVFVTGSSCYSCDPVLSDQRAAVLRQGGHVLSRQFRYYVPDFSGRTVVQTPISVR